VPTLPPRRGRLNMARILDQHLLSRVEKPSRYLGNEINAVGPSDKDMRAVQVRIALTFPDLYDIGLGNLGLHILYAVLNKLEWCWAERVYSPGLDLEKLLRADNLPLFALESKDSLDAFDGIAITLQSELNYTNILNIIDLAGLALRSDDRKEDDPLIFAGGPAVFNPEPLAPFIDFFVFGDGEDIIVEIADLFRRVRGRGARLEALSQMPGVYVPALYPMEQLDDGRILPAIGAAPVRKRLARDLDGAAFPVDYIVPFTQQVHDRISLEVLRGCTQGCRFCQAGMTTRPVRQRSIDNIQDLMQRTLDATGYEEVSLISLSTCDYSHVREMVDAVVRQAAPQRVSVSLPSLRLDSFSVEVADMVAGIRRTGLTFAPEAATPRLRSVINKWIPDEELLNMAGKAYGLGWDHVKLYFMIGLPTERREDVEAIADLTLRTLAVGRGVNRRARVNTGVSTFVPKPFTPFQWARQINMQETEERQRILNLAFRRENGVRFGRHKPASTFIEGLVGRADRRGADLIEAAYRMGARFEGWDEHLDLNKWLAAAEEAGTDAEFELRERHLDERLPWDHVDVMIPKQWFKEDWERAVKLQHAQDCRHSKCHRCGVIDVERPLCAHMLRTSIEGRKDEKTFERAPPPVELGLKPSGPGLPPVRPPEPPPAQRLVFRVGVRGGARFLTHLETMNAWLRALRRARAPVAYSEGFHPHPKVAFAGARPLAEETYADHMDVVLNARVDPALLLGRLQAVTPPGFTVFGVQEVGLRAASLMSSVAGADYVFVITNPPSDLGDRVGGLLEASSLVVKRRAKASKRHRGPPKMRDIELRPHVRSLELVTGQVTGPITADAGQALLRVSLDVVDSRGARPSEIIGLLEVEAADVRVIRLETRFKPVVAKGEPAPKAKPKGAAATQADAPASVAPETVSAERPVP
jgi:radical SAM family uncharacterized protein/radical SAM-linked protein